jgi:hypothetical protein
MANAGNIASPEFLVRQSTMLKEPLYRKVNTTAHGVHHLHGADFRDSRNAQRMTDSDANHQSMHGKKQRGLDYTPLFRFLLSKVGKDWDAVYSEAISRLDRSEPVYWLVAMTELEKQDCVRTGESSYFSGLFVDQNGILQLVNPNLGPNDLYPSCKCCTHTFNGKPFTNAFQPERNP